MKSHLQFLSLNINGLRDDVRRRGVFCWLKQLSFDIILLQDIRYQEGDNFVWSQEWGMAALWSSHNAILLTNRDLSITKVDPTPDVDRLLLGKVCMEGSQGDIIVGSVYVPAERAMKRRYLSNLPGSVGSDL